MYSAVTTYGSHGDFYTFRSIANDEPISMNSETRNRVVNGVCDELFTGKSRSLLNLRENLKIKIRQRTVVANGTDGTRVEADERLLSTERFGPSLDAAMRYDIFVQTLIVKLPNL